MLYEFIAQHRDDIIARTRERVRSRPWPLVSARELEDGVPLFLTQLSVALRSGTTVRQHHSCSTMLRKELWMVSVPLYLIS